MDNTSEPGAFHGNEAISAVHDEEQFYGEEDEYDDLYNDVNVGEGLVHSVRRRNDPVRFPVEEESRRHHPEPPPPPLPQPPPLQGTGNMPEKVHMPGVEPAPPVNRPPAPAPPVQGGAKAEVGQTQGQSGNFGFGNEGFQRQGGGHVNGGGSEGAGGSTLFVGELHWWTTDADLEAELSKYGPVKEVKFFDEKASGKSKGYCQVDFYDPMAAATCKDGMNGHAFNGRPCVVAFAAPHAARRMGEAQVKNHQITAGQNPALGPKGRGGAQMGGRGGGWGRGGMGNRGQVGGSMRNRMGPMGGGRGIIGNGGMITPQPPPPQQPVMHPAAMLAQGFDPTGYGTAMGRMGAGYGGFPAGPGAAPFPGMMPSFPLVVAPHVNPAFLGRGGMGAGGVGMWPDPSMGGWGGEEQSSYGDDAASVQHYGGGSHGKDRGHDRDQSAASDRRHDRESDLGPVQDWPDKRYRDDRELGRERDRERDSDREKDRDREREREREREKERDRYRDDRDRHGDHYKHREHKAERYDDWDRGRSSRVRSKSRELEHSRRRLISPSGQVKQLPLKTGSFKT